MTNSMKNKNIYDTVWPILKSYIYSVTDIDGRNQVIMENCQIKATIS